MEHSGGEYRKGDCAVDARCGTKGIEIDVWGRTMHVGSAGLPSQVSTQGMDILAGPMSLVAEADNGTLQSSPGAVAHVSLTPTIASLSPPIAGSAT